MRRICVHAAAPDVRIRYGCEAVMLSSEPKPHEINNLSEPFTSEVRNTSMPDSIGI